MWKVRHHAFCPIEPRNFARYPCVFSPSKQFRLTEFHRFLKLLSAPSRDGFVFFFGMQVLNPS